MQMQASPGPRKLGKEQVYMAFVKLPVFERGMVLTHEMLEQLKNYSQDMGNTSYTDYSDGFVSWCHLLLDGVRFTLK